MQLEFYFGDFNYCNMDDHMKECLDSNGYMFISEILKWRRMVHHKAEYHDVINASNFTQVFELSPDKQKIRRKEKLVNS